MYIVGGADARVPHTAVCLSAVISMAGKQARLTLVDALDDGGGSEAKRFRAQEAGADHTTAAGRRRPFASDAYESIH